MYRFWNQSKFVLDIQFEETRVYKDTYAKGKLDLALSQLEENCGQLNIELVRKVTALPIEQLEALAKALLKFKTVKDLEKWLQDNASETSGALSSSLGRSAASFLPPSQARLQIK
jgi:Domain of unknown function (DUF4351)